jgi:hypothetical protein
MTQQHFQALVVAAKHDRNAAVILARIKRGLPLQGGKPVKVEAR